MKKTINAQIVADSISPLGDRITTYLLTYPRFIHAELMTHRMFSRNSASSRAIPFETMLKMVKEDPFIPIAWQKDHSGMQGSEYFGQDETFISSNPMDRFANGITKDDGSEVRIVGRLKAEWLWARDIAVQAATNLNNCGVRYHPNGDLSKLTGDGRGLTKQLCNRLLEPFMWHTVLVTATEWNNFFELRCPKIKHEATGLYYKSLKDWNNIDKEIQWNGLTCQHPENVSQAEIHIQALAEAMWDAMNESKSKKLKEGEYHIPFIEIEEDLEITK